MALNTATAMVQTGVGNVRKYEAQSTVSAADAIALLEAKLALVAAQGTLSMSVSTGYDPADYPVGHAAGASGRLAIRVVNTTTKAKDTLIVENVSAAYKSPADDGTAVIDGDVAAYVDAYNTAKGTDWTATSATLTD